MVRLTVILLLCLASFHGKSAVWQVVYPSPSNNLDGLNAYPIQLLNLALEQTGVKYELLPSSTVMEQGQAVNSLISGREIHVLWSMTDDTRESQMLPIRIPIYKGLIGLRLLLVKQQDSDSLASVSSMEELRPFKFTQGRDWPDTKILRYNGFEVVTASYYDRLFDVLNQEQAQLFPRSVVEISLEHDRWKKRYPIDIEPNVALYYPTAVYYFVNKKNQVLANLIQTGLERAIANGTYERLFNEYHQPLLDQAQIEKRKILRLENPILPTQTPLHRDELWYPVHVVN